MINEVWHPNIGENGDVCISTLHKPGDEANGSGEAKTIVDEVISLLVDHFGQLSRNNFVITWISPSYLEKEEFFLII